MRSGMNLRVLSSWPPLAETPRLSDPPGSKFPKVVDAQEPPGETAAPADRGSESNVFNPNEHYWDGKTWWSKDRGSWWDGKAWRTKDSPATITAGTFAIGCVSVAIALCALGGSGACLSSSETPGFALVIGPLAVLVALATIVWIFVRKGHPALYLISLVAVLVSVLPIAYAIRGGCQ